MYASPNMSLMRLFIAGSSNLHPSPDLQLKVAGPRISSVKKSLISMTSHYERFKVSYDDLTNTTLLSTKEIAGNAFALYVITCIDCSVCVVSWLGL